MKLTTKAFLILLAVTLTVWILRGVGLLTFLPGLVIWGLLLLTISTGVVSRLQRF